MLAYSSYLVQRLKKPYKREAKTPLQLLCKYGLAATGIKPEIKEILSQVCIWDYMGSSEYEFGAIPRALKAMAGKELVRIADKIEFKYHDWKTQKDVTGSRPVFIICPKEDWEEIIHRIKASAMDQLRCKERPEVAESLGESEYSKDIYGWLELDNGYMFFKDLEMYECFSIMFGLDKRG